MARTAEGVKTLLRGTPNPIKTPDLIPLLAQMGIDVGGQSPSATLSARLSRSEGLIHTRGVGWSLTPENNNASGPKNEGESEALSVSHPEPAKAGSEVAHEKIS